MPLCNGFIEKRKASQLINVSIRRRRINYEKSIKATALAIAVGLSALGTAQAADRIAFIPKLVGVGFLPVVDKVQQKWAKH